VERGEEEADFGVAGVVLEAGRMRDHQQAAHWPVDNRCPASASASVVDMDSAGKCSERKNPVSVLQSSRC